MAVTVNTDVYDTVENVDTYWSDRGNALWVAADLSDKEEAMRLATDWLERNFVWPGVPATDTQRLHFPAICAYDQYDRPIGTTGAPLVVKEAMAIVADLYRLGALDLDGIVTNSSSAIVKQAVDGAVEVEYDPSKLLRGPDVPTHVYRMLASITGSPGKLRRV